MAKYLGETVMAAEDTPYRDYTEKDWALYFIGAYGGIDGAHHKDWVLDQAARALHGANPIIFLAKWGDGREEWRIRLDEPTQAYHDWVSELKSGEDGPETYSYEEGIAP